MSIASALVNVITITPSGTRTQFETALMSTATLTEPQLGQGGAVGRLKSGGGRISFLLARFRSWSILRQRSVKIALGIIPCIPLVPSTTCVTW